MDFLRMYKLQDIKGQVLNCVEIPLEKQDMEISQYMDFKGWENFPRYEKFQDLEAQHHTQYTLKLPV